MEYHLAEDVYEQEYQQELLKLINYSLWITLAVCGVGVLIVAAKIVIGYLDGNPQQEALGLLWVLGGCFLALSAASLISHLIEQMNFGF